MAVVSHFDALVDDVLIQILSLLPARDVLHLRQTSKRMEALSHVCAVWRALFARDVLTCGRPIPGLSFSPTPRLLQLCALDPSSEKLNTVELGDDKYDVALGLIEASDLEGRTLLALRLDKSWKTSHTSETTLPVSNRSGASESRLSTFETPTPVRDVFLVPGGRLVVTTHADRLRCWDLGVPHRSDSEKLQNSLFAGVKCVGELVFPQVVPSATICMDARPGASSVTKNGRHKEFSISFTLVPDIAPMWEPNTIPMEAQDRFCEIFSVRLDPLRTGSPSGSPAGSPFSTPVPSLLREGTVRLPKLLPTPSYPEGSTSAQTMIGEQWGPQRFARGKLGKLLLMFGPVMFFESFIPAAPAENDHDGVEGKPRYVGIEVLDCNEPTNTVLFEYPDPQVGPYVGIYVHASAEQVLVVWQFCAALYPLPFLTSNSSSVSLSGSPSGSASGSSSARSSRPSTPSRASPITKNSSLSPSGLPSPSTTPLSLSPGSSRSSLSGSVSVNRNEMEVDSGAEGDPELEPKSEPRRVVTMPNVVFTLSEPVDAPIAFSLCDVDVSALDFTRVEGEKRKDGELRLPHSLTIVARSRAQPSRNVQSVLTASPNPQATPTGRAEDKFTFRLSRIPTTTPDAELVDVAALALGPSGRGVRADVDGTLFRCTRSEVVLPRVGYGYGFGFGYEMKASSVPTVDFWPWKCAAVLPLSPSSSTISEDGEVDRLVLRFDDGMGRVVAARVSYSDAANRQVNGTSEITVLDFA